MTGPQCQVRSLAIISNAIYMILVHWLLGVEIPSTCIVGKGLRIFHGVGLVVHPATIIGQGCILRHCTTLGSKDDSDCNCQRAPILGDRVDVGCNVVIIGPVLVGNDSVIGAGSVVVHDVPDRAVVGGNPARIIKVPVHEEIG